MIFIPKDCNMIVALEPPNLYLAYFKGVGVSQIPRCRATGHALASLKEPFGSLARFAPEGRRGIWSTLRFGPCLTDIRWMSSNLAGALG